MFFNSMILFISLGSLFSGKCIEYMSKRQKSWPSAPPNLLVLVLEGWKKNVAFVLPHFKNMAFKYQKVAFSNFCGILTKTWQA